MSDELVGGGVESTGPASMVRAARAEFETQVRVAESRVKPFSQPAGGVEAAGQRRVAAAVMAIGLTRNADTSTAGRVAKLYLKPVSCQHLTWVSCVTHTHRDTGQGRAVDAAEADATTAGLDVALDVDAGDSLSQPVSYASPRCTPTTRSRPVRPGRGSSAFRRGTAGSARSRSASPESRARRGACAARCRCCWAGTPRWGWSSPSRRW